VALAYVVAFLTMVVVLGWHPQPLNKGAAPVSAAPSARDTAPGSAGGITSAPPPAIGSPGYQ
jgi:hypothetical protein